MIVCNTTATTKMIIMILRCCRSLLIGNFLQRDACALPPEATKSPRREKSAQVASHGLGYNMESTVLYRNIPIMVIVPSFFSGF